MEFYLWNTHPPSFSYFFNGGKVLNDEEKGRRRRKVAAAGCFLRKAKGEKEKDNEKAIVPWLLRQNNIYYY